MSEGQSQSAPPAGGYCERCGAEISQYDSGCWLCNKQVASPADAAPASTSAPANAPAQTPVKAPAAALMGRQGLGSTRHILYGCVGLLGVPMMASDPGSALGFAIFVAPAVIAIEVVNRRALARGVAPSGCSTIGSFLLVSVVSWILGMVGIVACLGIICAGALGGGGGMNSDPPAWSIGFAVLMGIAVIFGIIRLAIYMATDVMLGKQKGKVLAGQTQPAGAKPSQAKQPFTLSQIMIAVAVLTVCAGLGAGEPVLAILLAVVTVPALLHTLRRRAKAEALGKPEGFGTSFGNFLLAGAFSLLILGAGAVVLLFVVCTSGSTFR